jgi:hypothetical protein
MQGLPQPVDQDSVDGCPVVEISDDPVDVEYLLKALYNPSVHLTCLKACSDFVFDLYIAHFIARKSSLSRLSVLLSD